MASSSRASRSILPGSANLLHALPFFRDLLGRLLLRVRRHRPGQRHDADLGLDFDVPAFDVGVEEVLRLNLGRDPCVLDRPTAAVAGSLARPLDAELVADLAHSFGVRASAMAWRRAA